VAVQIAKARGAYVIGTASAGKHEFLRGLGADELIDYRETEFTEAVRDVDVVLDTIGGENTFRSLHVLREGGIVVSILPMGPEELYKEAAALGVRAARMLVEADHAGMRAVADLVDAGKLRATIAGTAARDDRRDVPAGRCRRGTHARRHRPDHGQAGAHGRLEGMYGLSTRRQVRVAG
jgi:NADPH:quinone reductase-like Zn-dependent oxidoreductase